MFTYPDSPQPPAGWPTLRIFSNSQFAIAWAMLILGIIGTLSLLRTRAWPIALMLPLSMAVYSLIAFLIDYRLVLPVLALTLVADLEGLAFLLPGPFWAIEHWMARLFGSGLQPLSALAAADSTPRGAVVKWSS